MAGKGPAAWYIFMPDFGNPRFLDDSLRCGSPPGVKLVREGWHGQSSPVCLEAAPKAASVFQVRDSSAIFTCGLFTRRAHYCRLLS
jgi:hypothetical protein